MRRIAVLLILLFFPLINLYAAESGNEDSTSVNDSALESSLTGTQLVRSTYVPGDYLINIRIPLYIPTITYDIGAKKTYKGKDMGFLYILGALDISVDAFYTDKITFGGQLGYMFGFARDEEVVSFVPFMFKLGYVPLQGRVDMPINFGIGFAYSTYLSTSSFMMATSLEIGPNIFFSDNWGLNIKAGFWLFPEILCSVSKMSLGVFSSVSIGVTYRN